MSLFNQLSDEAAKRGLGFLVIGGHAVIEYGFQRGTEDADILIRKGDREPWREIIQGLGYKMFRDGGNFIQFEPNQPDQWDLDVMLVPELTFDRLIASAQPATLEGAAVMVPSFEHLMALKIHALKHGHGLRVLKDTTDVAELLLVNRVDPKSAWLRALFEKHADMQIYERVIKLLT